MVNEDSQSDGAEFEQAARLDEPPVVVVPPTPIPRMESTPAFAGYWSRLMREKAYGAPRVFDLFTLLAVTLAFALLFAGLRLLEPLLDDEMPQVAMTISVFMTLSAIAQMTLWGGEQPRLASVVSGPFIGGLIGFAMTIYYRDFSLVFGTMCMMLFGAPAGYLGGAVVAGVFLVADAIRRRYVKPASQGIEPDVDDHIWRED